MYKVFDAQGNYVLVHHLIDVRSYIEIGYVDYEEAIVDEKYSSSNKSTYKSMNKKYYFNIESRNKFNTCECYSTKDISKPIRNSDCLTIIGTADTVFNDIKRYGVHGDVAVVNDSAFYYQKFDHFITVHGKLIPIVESYRNSFRSYEKFRYQTHSAIAKQCGLIECDQNNANYLWKFRPVYRSSGLLAIWIGIALGYKSILVHGITMEERNHFYDFNTSPVKSQFSKLFSLINNDQIKDLLVSNNVKVSSGIFSEFIGKPTRSWINANKSSK